jgi:hypothetical protein
MAKNFPPAFLRWTPEEWTRVGAYALRHVDKGLAPVTALTKAAREALPADRQKDEYAAEKASRSPSFHEYIIKARAMTPEQLQEIAPPPAPRAPRACAPRKRVDEGRDYSGSGSPIRWTTAEKARIARQVDRWREAGDLRATSRLIIEAQELVIDVDRRRPTSSIQAGLGRKNDLLLAEGRANAWTLPNDEVQSEVAQSEPGEVAVSSSESPDEFPAQASNTGEATTPAPTAQRKLSDAAQAFAAAVSVALDDLLAAHTESILQRVYARFESTATATSVALAAQIERGMRDTVHRIVEQELGGPVSAPFPNVPAEAPPGAQAATKAQATEVDQERQEKVRVDIVGLIGPQITHVKQAFNGSTDLRFVDADQVTAWKPSKARHVICAIKWISHDATEKAKSYGIRPHNIIGGADAIIHAIEEIHRSSGIAAH